MKLGDLIANDYTMPDNPYHVLMVINTSGDMISCVDGSGRVLQFRKRDQKKDNFLRVVGHITFPEWDIARDLEIKSKQNAAN